MASTVLDYFLPCDYLTPPFLFVVCSTLDSSNTRPSKTGTYSLVMHGNAFVPQSANLAYGMQLGPAISKC